MVQIHFPLLYINKLSDEIENYVDILLYAWKHYAVSFVDYDIFVSNVLYYLDKESQILWYQKLNI